MSYDPFERVADGPFTAPRQWHHVLKALIALSIYAVARDGLHCPPWAAAMIASPLFMVLLTVKEWNWPSDPDEHSYPARLRVGDFLTDFSCTSLTMSLAFAAYSLWLVGIAILPFFAAIYFGCRHDARP